ncbi:MAG: MotA/TolQ/ExbB proton channel family protein [Brevinematales bacterium]|nr:MotA/TolQ/ExbB proton channel family protein [Brevinematales bacterium]
MFNRALVIFLLISSFAFGEGETNAKVIEKKPKITFLDSFVEFNKMGGIFIYPLYALSILGLAYVLERFFFYNFKKKLWEERLLNDCKNFEIKVQELKENVEKSNSRMGDVLKEIFRLSKKRKKLEELDKVLEMEVNGQINELQKGFTMISAIINLAPLIGFLGTVSGMIAAFKSIYQADQVSITLVAKGIYEALITTEVGLIIAIVVNFFYSLFVQKVERFTQMTVEAGENLIERIVENEN